MLAYGSPRHFVVRHVLLRLLAPRHPPCALPSLTIDCSDLLHRFALCFAQSVNVPEVRFYRSTRYRSNAIFGYPLI